MWLVRRESEWPRETWNADELALEKLQAQALALHCSLSVSEIARSWRFPIHRHQRDGKSSAHKSGVVPAANQKTDGDVEPPARKARRRDWLSRRGKLPP